MKKRILFVEDDPLLLHMYASMLDDQTDLWEVQGAGDARQALQAMEKAPFDVVVSDMMMPGMDGAALMSEVRTRYPRTSRIILSVLSDQGKVADCLGATHQFIAKPFDVKMLKATLARISSLDAYLNDEKLQRLVGQLGTLPSFPSLYLDVMKELASPNSSIESIAAIIRRDPAMTAKMLQIVNSAAVGLSRQISSPFEAVEYLGLGTVRSLVLSAHIFSCFERTSLEGFSVNRIWDHAMKSAALARMIMQLERPEPDEVEDAYTAGMLHDVGKLMLADSLPDQFEEMLKLAEENHVSLHEAELQVFGASHAGVAGYLLGLWGLPAAIVEAVAFHHTPSHSETRSVGPLLAVHAADVLAHELSAGQPCGETAALEEGYLATLGLQDRWESWRTQAERLVHSRNGH